MKPFKDFEVEVVRALLRTHMPEDDIEAVVESGTLVSCDHTGNGYFLTVRHSALPVNRLVCVEPMLIGVAGEATCGFVVFLENSELILECHSWGDDRVPVDIRERQMQLTTA